MTTSQKESTKSISSIAGIGKQNKLSNKAANSDSDSESESESAIVPVKSVNIKSKLFKNGNSDSDSDSESESDNVKSKQPKQSDIFNDTNHFTSSGIMDVYTINIRTSNRNSRKYTTTIENIPERYFEDEPKMKNMIKKIQIAIASRATLKKCKDENKYIEFSGNKVDVVIKLLNEELQCGLENIKLHGKI